MSGAVRMRSVPSKNAGSSRQADSHICNRRVPPANIEQRFADDPFVAHVVVYGDGKKFLTAGVWLDDAAVKAWRSFLPKRP